MYCNIARPRRNSYRWSSPRRGGTSVVGRNVTGSPHARGCRGCFRSPRRRASCSRTFASLEVDLGEVERRVGNHVDARELLVVRRQEFLDDERGPLTGRSDVRAPDTDVRITMGAPDRGPGRDESSRLSTQVSPISERLEPAEETSEDPAPTRVNEEDILPEPDEPAPSTHPRRREAPATEATTT